MIDSLLGLFVCLSVLRFLEFVLVLRYAVKRIVNIMKVSIERNNLQVELIRFRKIMLTFHSRLLLRSEGFTHRTHSRKFRTQTTSAPFLKSSPTRDRE